MLAAAAAAALLAACGGAPRVSPGGRPATVGFSGIQPGVAFAGAGPTQITLATTAILSAADDTVLWNGQPLPTTGETGFLVGTVPGSDLTTPGMAQVSIQLSNNTVTNSLPFYILPAAQANAGVVQLVSANLQGQPSDGNISSWLAISATGRYVAFQSAANDLVAGPADTYGDIFERDTCIGAPTGCVPETIRITVTPSGGLEDGNSYDPSISADGRYVAFDSNATNLIGGLPAPNPNISIAYLRDTCIGAPAGCVPRTMLISADGQGNWVLGAQPGLSASARYAVWQGPPSLYGGNGSYPPQIGVRDTCIGAGSGCTPGSVLASVNASGAQSDGGGYYDAISPDGRFAVFQSWSSNLAPGTSETIPHVYLRDTCLGAAAGCIPQTVIVDATPGGVPANYGSSDLDRPAVSSGGRYVAFDTNSKTTNLAVNPNHIGDLFVRDTCNGAPAGCVPSVTVVSVPISGTQANGGSDHPSLTPDGRYIAFASLADNLVLDDPGPLDGTKDIFVRDTCHGAATPCKPITLWASVTSVPGNPYVPSLSDCEEPALSADGHYVAFISDSVDLLFPFHVTKGSGKSQIFVAKTGF